MGNSCQVSQRLRKVCKLKSLSILILDMEVSPIMQCMYLLELKSPNIRASLNVSRAMSYKMDNNDKLPNSMASF